MYTHSIILQGKRGVKQLDQWGPYAVIVNKRLYEQGKAGKYAVVNMKDHWVDSVHRSRVAAASEAHERSRP